MLIRFMCFVEMIIIPHSFKQEIMAIRVKFGTLVINIIKALYGHHVSIKYSLRVFLHSSYPYLEQEIKSYDSIDHMLEVISKKHCTLIDISILETLVTAFEVSSAVVHIESYKSSIAEFCRNISISLALQERFKYSSPLQCETATFVLDWNPDHHYTIDDAKCLLSGALEHLSINIKVEVIGKGIMYFSRYKHYTNNRICSTLQYRITGDSGEGFTR